MISSEELQRKSHLSGTCTEMCPREEMLLRERQKRLSKFEVTSGTEKWKFPKADPQKAVKEYSRCAAGKVTDESTLRHALVLIQTVDYLLRDISTLMDTDIRDVYYFVSDRLRAVKQDLVIQRIGGNPAVEILEKSLRFFIYAKYKCYEENFFDIKLHIDQIKDYIHLLKEFYRSDVIDPKKRIEFEVYFLLLDINSEDSYREVLTLPNNIKNSRAMNLALRIARAYREHNYVRFFRLVKDLPFLSLCALYKNIGTFRSWGLNIMCTAYSSKVCSFPINKLTNLLAYDDKDQADLDCRSHGIEISSKGIHFIKGKFTQGTKEVVSHEVIDRKFNGSLSSLLLNQ